MISSILQWDKLGNYPKGYDPTKHGPFDPSRYYGTPDTPFGDVKIRELPAWLWRREKGLGKLLGLFSRAYWRWNLKYIQPRKANMSPVYQVAVISMILFYTMNYTRIRGHRSYKYH
ncbi:Putative ATP synthase subunit f, mitochondrial [Habropoda laboriosa]|uniref:Putative ATP synthase subunit f, mitochondrial n=2 Tax=Habropoda laboriosa TaxID=597456 RepID=A0A0L7R0W4_9HYME|nr:Putative ATP synthase subunit f, mitochondrial [Habropoda laboriosa]